MLSIQRVRKLILIKDAALILACFWFLYKISICNLEFGIDYEPGPIVWVGHISTETQPLFIEELPVMHLRDVTVWSSGYCKYPCSRMVVISHV